MGVRNFFSHHTLLSDSTNENNLLTASCFRNSLYCKNRFKCDVCDVNRHCDLECLILRSRLNVHDCQKINN